MVEVTIDSIRVSLMSQNRIVLLREQDSERFLAIWIGPAEADAITLRLQGMDTPRPLTHDLLKTFIETLGGEVIRVVVNGLEKNTYYSQIVVDVNGELMEIDSRPSDAIALAVRVDAPICISSEVMDEAGMEPEEELSLAGDDGIPVEVEEGEISPEDLEAFKDFVDGLDLDNLLGGSSK